MTDLPRAAGAHPSPDELADLRADILDDARASEIAAHVADCPDCTAELEAIDEVEALLHDEGSAPVAMPDDVSAALDAALARAAAERSAGVASLDDQREARVASAAAAERHRSRWGKLTAAAAVVVVLGLGGVGLGQVLSGQSGGDSDMATSDDSGADSLAEAEGDGGGAGSGSAQDLSIGPQRVTRESLPLFARSLQSKANRSAEEAPRPMSTQLRHQCPPLTANYTDSATRAPVRFEGQLAVVEVRADAREVTVYSCGSPSEPLYSTSY